MAQPMSAEQPLEGRLRSMGWIPFPALLVDVDGTGRWIPAVANDVDRQLPSPSGTAARCGGSYVSTAPAEMHQVESRQGL